MQAIIAKLKDVKFINVGMLVETWPDGTERME